jgi:hypothetical protein
MTQYSTNANLSTDAVNTQAYADGGTNSTQITQFTAQTPTGSFNNLRTATITSGGTIGANYCRVAQNGYGDSGQLISYNGPGNIAANTATEILFHFRAAAISLSDGFGYVRAAIAGGVANPAYSLGVTDVATGTLQLLIYAGSASSGHVGTTVAKGIVANTWYWVRIKVDASNNWSWKLWSGTFASEPGYDVTGAADTTNTSGYVGLAAIGAAGMPMDYDWFSAATAGDPAPGPVLSPPPPPSYYLSNDTYL